MRALQPCFFLLVVFASGISWSDGIPVVVVPDKPEDLAKLPGPVRKQITTAMPKPFKVEADLKCSAEHVFVIAGENSDLTLERMNCLAGVPISVLTARMLPQKFPHEFPASVDRETYRLLNGKLPYKEKTYRYRRWLQTRVFDLLPVPWKGDPWRQVEMRGSRISNEGFLNVDQSLRQVLLKDNRTARRMKLTHQQISEPLLQAIAKYEKASAERKIASADPIEMPFEWKDATGAERHYTIKGIPMGHLIKPKKRSGWGVTGTQGSPFPDEIQANWILEVHAASGNASLSIDTLTPYLIYRYGFYQGGYYRKLGPEEIAQFFHLSSG